MFDRLFGRIRYASWLPFSRKVDDHWENQIVWLPIGHERNPFAQEVLDCRSVAHGFSSATSDASIAGTFCRLRASDGSECIGQLPANALCIQCRLRFPYNGKHKDGPLFIAKEMEDKWDFYAYDSVLYIRRSWTGLLVHVAELEYGEDAVVVHRIYSDSGSIFNDSEYAEADLQFLITSHFGNNLVPFPVPPVLPREATKEIALTGFSQYGRRAQFVAFSIRPKHTLHCPPAQISS